MFKRRLEVGRFDMTDGNDGVAVAVIDLVEPGAQPAVVWRVQMTSDHSDMLRDADFYIGTHQEPDTWILYEGEVHSRVRSIHSVHVDFRPRRGEVRRIFSGNLSVDAKAFEDLPVGTPVYLCCRLKTKPVPSDQLSAAALLAPLVYRPLEQDGWRFELTLDDAATVPFQQLCHLGLLVGVQQGWMEKRDDTAVVFHGPGGTPPPALMQWCRDNDITCAVQATA